MSINDATPQDWNKLRATYPAIEPTIREPLAPADITPLNTRNSECLDYLEDTLKEGFAHYLDGAIIRKFQEFRQHRVYTSDLTVQTEVLESAKNYLSRLIATINKP